ncbi:abortive infection family protein [Acinetobacter suaedae]|uniref:Abortive infection family protein n=1 Tax=Acinetobacter suaedae TaxID=2609668 RepID=A0A5P1UWS4_9GAMM|nr:abortive infection family protein [Acinetobacter sp. C16S1]QER41024.1 abortive infection family protein [Acinetobacter sp. C16S1]
MSKIPLNLIAILSEVLPEHESHATLDNLFLYAEINSEIPDVSKPAKVQQVLMNVNKSDPDPLKVLGKVLEKYLDGGILYPRDQDRFDQQIESIKKILSDNSLLYIRGGIISGSLTTPTKSLESVIKGLEIPALDQEFMRALTHVDASPREAVSAASNILESICKVYIAENNLTMPNKKDLKNLFDVVRKSLNIQRDSVEDEDLLRIISGIISVVDGIASLRTHASSAHGAGVKQYNLKPRHARLAIHAAHTIGLYVLESWKESKK